MDKQTAPTGAGQASFLSRSIRGGRAFLARPAVDRGLRWLGWGLFVAWLLFVALVLALRYAVLPGIATYKTEIEAAASKASVVISWRCMARIADARALGFLVTCFSAMRTRWSPP